MTFFSSSKTIGILGGGQLGKMLLYNTRKWDIKTKVLDNNPNAPAKLSCDEFHVGDLMDYQTVLNFAKNIDVLTIEIENVNVKALEEIEKKGIKVYPQPNVLAIIQNKLKQKKFYKENKIPTAPFREFKSIKSIKEEIIHGNLCFPFVWKSNSMGYDGFGVKIIKSNRDIEELNDTPGFIEDLVEIKKELSVIICRNVKGEIKNFPVVEMIFNNDSNQVEYIISPARINNEISRKAISIALKLSKLYNHVGIMAIELFLTSDNEILINEVAPRPHNSGHFSIEMSYTSQFEQHIRAILGLPLGEAKNKISGVMVNLVGEKQNNGPVKFSNIDQIMTIEGVTPHIYGKKETRPNRKMGHVTIVNEKIENAIKIAKKVKETIKVISK
ncbi:MAG: 5-(carboxyamino)imidazole ribonucleotide synthase [Flavobacteriaceae bacterium]|nr:5-(carboxyamino)imidazole ribonucleotide synthase [Flavobacteriaceae bacterium]|tara:strand:+ start:44572 stop:45726 length:1155 start_codon:yes stop_codon:yes gene_type:complete